MSIGLTAHNLGAGRQIPGDSINYAVGVQLKVQVGDFVNEGKALIFWGQLFFHVYNFFHTLQ